MVDSAGTIGFRGHQLFLSRALDQQHVGLEETADGIWSVYFCHALLGKFAEQDYRIYP